jgi:hypothetical protein
VRNRLLPSVIIITSLEKTYINPMFYTILAEIPVVARDYVRNEGTRENDYGII